MPKHDANSPATSQPIIRLCLGVSSVRGVSSSLNLPGQCMCPCLADDAE